MQTLNYFFVSLKNSSRLLSHIKQKKKDDTLKDSRTRGALLLEDFRKRRRSRRAALLPFLVSSFFTFAIVVVVVVVVVHAHTERERVFQNSSFGEKKKPRPRGIRKSQRARARVFSLRDIKRKSHREEEEEVSSREAAEEEEDTSDERDGSIVRFDGGEILALSLHLGKPRSSGRAPRRRKRIDVSISLVDRRLRLGVNRRSHWRRVRLAKVSEWEL